MKKVTFIQNQFGSWFYEQAIDGDIVFVSPANLSEEACHLIEAKTQYDGGTCAWRPFVGCR